MWHQQQYLMCVVFVCVLLQPLHASTCTYQGTQYYSHVSYSTVYYASKYTIRCWNLWSWFKCTKYRQKSKSQSYTDVSTRTLIERRCCPGWSGTSCTTHAEPPVTKSCPVSFEVQASGPQERVSWTEPQFEEPHGYDLRVQSSHQSPAMLPWGSTSILYTATSTNNNQQATCQFDVFVKPPVDKPYIVDYEGLSSVDVEDGLDVDLECRADTGNPPFHLQWTLDGTDMAQRYSTEVTSQAGYENAVSKVHFVANRTDDGKSLACRATKPGRSPEEVRKTLNVAYDPHPVVDFCPADKELESSERVTGVSLRMPRFSDINNDPLTTTCSVPSYQELPFGVYEIQCRAENSRTHATASCRYSVSVKPHACSPPAAPGHGAFLCADYEDSYVTLCKPLCEDGHDVTFRAVVPELYVCGLDGQWFPDLPAINCSDTWTSGVGNMPSVDHYLPGGLSSCSAAASDIGTMELFSTTVSNSPYRDVCFSAAAGDCLPSTDLRVICGF